MQTISTAKDARPVRRLLLQALVLGIFLGAKWSSRYADVFGSAVPSLAWQIVAVLSLVFMAALVRNLNAVPFRLINRIGFAAFVIHVICVLTSLSVSGSAEVLALGIVSTCFLGIAIACAELLILSDIALAFSAKPSPRSVAISISVGLLIANLYDTAWSNVSSSVAEAQFIVGVAVAFAYLWWATTKKRRDPGSAFSESTSASALASGSRAQGYLRGAVLLSATILILAQGALSFVYGFGGAGAHASFSLSTEILMLGVRVMCIALIYFIAGKNYEPAAVALCGIIWMTGISLLAIPLSADSALQEPGMLVIEIGMYFLQALILSWACGARISQEGSRVSFVALAAAAVSACEVTRNLPHLFYSGDPVALAVPVLFSSAISVSVAMAILVLGAYCSSPRKDSSMRTLAGDGEGLAMADVLEPKPGSVPSAEANFSDAGDEEIVLKGRDFARRIVIYCDANGLTDRERQIVFASLHGSTIGMIADDLGLSRETVKTHMSRIYRRCAVGGRQEMLERILAIELPGSPRE
jgi:DNA-binding CsgD family transcriptional regulator